MDNKQQLIDNDYSCQRCKNYNHESKVSITIHLILFNFNKNALK